MTDFLLLHELPPDHPLRLRPLEDMECRNHKSKEWRKIGKSWNIAKSCYNQLTDSWTASTEFRFVMES